MDLAKEFIILLIELKKKESLKSVNFKCWSIFPDIAVSALEGLDSLVLRKTSVSSFVSSKKSNSFVFVI